MGLNRTLAYGWPGAPTQLPGVRNEYVDPMLPPSTGPGSVVGDGASCMGRQTTPMPEGAAGLTTSPSRRPETIEEETFPTVDNWARTNSQSSRHQPSVIPAGQSSARENVPSPQIEYALRNLAQGQNPTESLVQLLAGLLNTRANLPPTEPRNSVPTYHVVPDFSRDIEYFTGERDSIRAREWLDNLESLREMHHWSEEHLLASARMHLRDGARDWARCRVGELRTWEDF